MWRFLTEEGIFVNVVVPPAVPSTHSIIRIALTAALTDAHLDHVLDALERGGRRFGLLPGAGVAEEIAKIA